MDFETTYFRKSGFGGQLILLKLSFFTFVDPTKNSTLVLTKIMFEGLLSSENYFLENVNFMVFLGL